MTTRSAHGFLALGLLASVLGGCGGEEGPKVVFVNGAVSVNGKPLEGAGVTFVPEPGPRESTTGNGTSDSSGRYRLRTRYGDGVAPGKYKVTISLLAAAGPGTKPGDPIEGDRIMAVRAGRARQKFPAYANAATTPFTADVPESGRSFDFNVDSKKAITNATANGRRRMPGPR